MGIFKRLSIPPSASPNISVRPLKQQPCAGEMSADRLPDIRIVITDLYRGAIYMIIRDVDHVMVSILSAEGKEVEKGPAMNSSGVWSYRTAVTNPAFSQGKVIVRAGNIRGDQAEMRVAVC